MIDATEISHIGSCPRREGEARTIRWPDQQGLPETSRISSGEALESQENVFGDEWCESADSSSNGKRTGGDNCIGYGSISISRNESSQLLKIMDNERSEGMKQEQSILIPTTSFRSFLDRNDDRLFSKIFGIFDHRVDSDEVQCRRNNKPLMAWMLLILLSVVYLASFGIASFYNGGGTVSVAGLFIFDDLFRRINNSPSEATLEPSLFISRSILLVMHAETTPINPIVKDQDRKLTAKGMRDAKGLGIYLNQHNIAVPEWIFVSPAERTAYTTELIRQNWASDVDVAFEDYLYTLGFNDYFTFVAGLNDHFRRIMIVGHNPAILNTARKLMGTHGIEDFPDCGFLEIFWNDLKQWKDVRPNSGSSTLAIDPNHKFFFSSRQGNAW